METFQVLVLAAVQGLTEFLPISSSAHLLLPEMLLHWPRQGRAFDVAVHLGSLLAVVHFFRAKLKELFFAWCRSFTGQKSASSQLAWMLFIGTLPAVAAGLFLQDWINLGRGSIVSIAVMTIVFGLLLWWADWRGGRRMGMDSLGWKGALFIGAAQALALVPGVSRSGITLTAGLWLGLRRTEAAAFSFLLAVPVIAGASVFEGYALFSEAKAVPWREMLLGILVSGLIARLCIAVFLRTVARIGMAPFAVYRLALGALLLVLA